MVTDLEDYINQTLNFIDNGNCCQGKLNVVVVKVTEKELGHKLQYSDSWYIKHYIFLPWTNEDQLLAHPPQLASKVLVNLTFSVPVCTICRAQDLNVNDKGNRKQCRITICELGMGK